MTLIIALSGCAAPPPAPTSAKATSKATPQAAPQASTAKRPPEPRFDPGNPRNAPTQDDYPIPSRMLGEQGDVVIAVLVWQDGRTGEIRLAQSSGFPRLDEAAIAFYRTNGKFLPAEENGKKIAAWKWIKVVWKLKQPPIDVEPGPIDW